MELSHSSSSGWPHYMFIRGYFDLTQYYNNILKRADIISILNWLQT